MLKAATREQSTLKPNRERTRHNAGKGNSVREADEGTTFVEAQHYLDFKYGVGSVDIALLKESLGKLVVAADGRVFFQVPFDS